MSMSTTDHDPRRSTTTIHHDDPRPAIRELAMHGEQLR